MALPPALPAQTASWNRDADAAWSDAANWSPNAVPNGVDAAATLGGVISADRSITLGSDVVLGRLAIDSRFGYTLAGKTSLTFQTTAGPATFTVGNTSGDAAHRLAVDLHLVSDLTLNQQSSQPLTLEGAFSASGPAVTLAKTGAGTVIFTGPGAGGGPAAGRTVVNEGQLIIDRPGHGLEGLLTIGDGLGGEGADRVTLGRSYRANADTPVVVNSSGWFDLAGQDERAGALQMTGGQITTGAGTLILSENVATLPFGSSARIAGKLDLKDALRVFNVADGGALYDLDISASISSGGVFKNGLGALRLSGVSDYKKDTVVREGTLAVGADAPSGRPGALGDSTAAIQLGDNPTPGGSPVTLLIDGPFAVGRDLQANPGGLSTTIGGRNTGAGAIYSGDVRLLRDTTLIAEQSSDRVVFSGSIFDGVVSFGIAKTGAGAVSYQGTTPNRYFGDTVVQSATLELAKRDGVDAIAGGTAIVQGGGTLLLGANNQIADRVTLRLAGGTFGVNGKTETVGRLTLTQNSVVDFGEGSGRATIQNWSLNDGLTLNVANWSGDYIRGGGADQLHYGTITSEDLSQIRFVNPAGLPAGLYLARLIGSEIVPVPEPSTVAALVLLGGGLVWRERRRRAT